MRMGWPEVCRYIIDPRIYQMNIEALINLDTWRKLPERFQRLMTDCMIENEKRYLAIMTELAEKEYHDMQEKGMKLIRFSPQETRWYVELAYQAGWDEVVKQNPELGPKLKRMLKPK